MKVCSAALRIKATQRDVRVVNSAGPCIDDDELAARTSAAPTSHREMPGEIRPTSCLRTNLGPIVMFQIGIQLRLGRCALEVRQCRVLSKRRLALDGGRALLRGRACSHKQQNKRSDGNLHNSYSR